jgi:hypothetical protein
VTIRLAIGSAIAVLLAGCAAGGPESVTDGAPAPVVPAAPTPEPSVTSVYAAGMTFGTTRDSVQRRLGPPRRTTAEAEPNRHDASVTDTIHTLFYDDLTFTFLEAGGSRREFLLEVDASGGRPAIPGFAIGRSTRGEIVAALGEPQRVDTIADTLALAYATPGPGAEDFVALLTVRDVLRRVRWAPYVD